MRIAIVTVDNRDEDRRHHEPEPRFGQPITALLEGMRAFPEDEINVVACVHEPVPSPTRLGPNVFYHSVRVRPWGWLRGGYLGCVRAIRGRLRELRPDVVHGQGTERYCALAAAGSGFPNVLTLHGNMRAVARVNAARLGSYLWLAAFFERFALPRVGGVLCNSQHTLALAAPLARRTWLVPNALQSVFFSPAACEAASPPVVLSVGAVVAHKDQLRALRVGREVARRGGRFQLRFHGRLDATSAYGQKFRQALDEARAEGWADYGGELSPAELVRALDSASALLHLPQEEAFGLVVAEAQARNLKLFGARVGGVPDIAEGVEGAELFAPEDDAGLVNALVRWLAAGAPRPTAAAAAMRARFHPEVVARRHREIYLELITAGARATEAAPPN